MILLFDVPPLASGQGLSDIDKVEFRVKIIEYFLPIRTLVITETMHPSLQKYYTNFFYFSRIINGYRNQNDIFHTLSHIVKGDGNHTIYHGRPISIPCIRHRIMYMERYRHDFPLFRLLFMVKHPRFPWGTERSKLWNDVECTRITDLILQ